jgi:hypothetical protein
MPSHSSPPRKIGRRLWSQEDPERVLYLAIPDVFHHLLPDFVNYPRLKDLGFFKRQASLRTFLAEASV